MKTVRIGNDITIRWTLVFADSGETLAGKELKLYLKHPLITKREVSDYTVEDNVLTWVFRGAEQKKAGVYSLELVCNDGSDGMWTIDACDAVELVPCTCKAGGTGGDVELFGKVDTLNGNVIVTAVDKELDAESENPIANKAVAREIEALKENSGSGSSAFVVETAGNKILGLTNNSTSATILNAIGGDFNAIAQAIREGRQIVFKDTMYGKVINASLTGYSVYGDTKSITINFTGDAQKKLYNKRISNTNGALKCETCDREISDGAYIGTKTYIGQNVNIGEGANILGSCTIGAGVKIDGGIMMTTVGSNSVKISQSNQYAVLGSHICALEVHPGYYGDENNTYIGYAVKIGSGVQNLNGGTIGTGVLAIYGTSSYGEAICFQYGTTHVYLSNNGLLDKNGTPIVGTGSSGTGGGNVNIGSGVQVGYDGAYYTFQPIDDQFNSITKIGTNIVIDSHIHIERKQNGIEFGDGIGSILLIYQ